jgi:allantoin racemase
VTRILVLMPGPPDPAITAELGAAQLAGHSWNEATHFEFVRPKTQPAQWHTYSDWFQGDLAYVEAGAEAERDGFDAVCVLSAGDMGVKELRSLLRIPVIGVAQIMYAVALLLGSRFSLLIEYLPQATFYERGMREYGVLDRCASIRASKANYASEQHDFLQPSSADQLARLVQTGRKCIEEDRADVLCVPLHVHWACAELERQLSVPVVNGGPLVLKTAEMLAELGLRQSKLTYSTRSGEGQTGWLHAAARAVETL